jgi:hypothetical protein
MEDVHIMEATCKCLCAQQSKERGATRGHLAARHAEEACHARGLVADGAGHFTVDLYSKEGRSIASVKNKAGEAGRKRCTWYC